MSADLTRVKRTLTAGLDEDVIIGLEFEFDQRENFESQDELNKPRTKFNFQQMKNNETHQLILIINSNNTNQKDVNETDDEGKDDREIESNPMLHSQQQSNRIQLDSQKSLDSNQTKKHIWGFYCYSFASEIFSIVAVSLFLPITLEQFARDNGFQYPNHQIRCEGSIKNQSNQSIIIKPLLNEISCDVKLFGKWFDTASFPLYVFSISVAIQAILVCSLGDSADHPTIRKLLLIGFAGIGSFNGICLFFLNSESIYWSSISIFTILSNVSLGVSLVCLNSFIPSISKTQPNLIEIKLRLDEKEEEGEDLIELKKEYDLILSNTISNLSSKGISIGFTAGILCLFISLIPITIRNGDTTSLRWAVGSSAIWWAIFTIPAAIWLPPSNWKTNQSFSKTFNPKKSWHQFHKMICSRNKLKHTFYYLMSWFLLSDAYSTITSTAIIFGKTTLKMSSSHLILIGIITPATGILGALIIPNYLQPKLSYCNGINGGLKMFKVLIGLSCLIPLYVVSAVIFGSTALTREWELFVLAAVFGVLYGAFQSYARSLFAELIPPGQEAKWYALFSITDKSSSFFGPFIVGVIADLTHNIRYGFIFILLILLISLPLLNLIQMEIGKEDAFRFSEEEVNEEED